MRIQLTIEGTELERYKKFMKLHDFVQRERILIELLDETAKPQAKPASATKKKDESKTKKKKSEALTERAKLGAKFRWLREELGYSQVQISQLTSIKQIYVSAFERGVMSKEHQNYSALYSFLDELENAYRKSNAKPSTPSDSATSQHH